LHLISKFNKTCWKICAMLFNFCGAIFKLIQDKKSFRMPFKVHMFNLSWPNYILMPTTSRTCIFFIQCSISIKICWIMFPLKSSYCGKIYRLIQVFKKGLGTIWSSKSRHFGITMSFGGLFLLYIVCISNNFFWKSCAYS